MTQIYLPKIARWRNCISRSEKILSETMERVLSNRSATGSQKETRAAIPGSDNALLTCTTVVLQNCRHIPVIDYESIECADC